MRTGRKMIATLAILGLVSTLIPLVAAHTMNLQLQPGPFAPNSSGRIIFRIEDGVLLGRIRVQDLPAQGSHAFYVLWFVRTDTGDKAFLGPIVDRQDNSILFIVTADGLMTFKASAYTAGPDAGSSISLGAPGKNFFVLIAENQIDTFSPHPVSEPPASFALMVTF